MVTIRLMAVSLTFDISIEFKIDFISTLLKKKKNSTQSLHIQYMYIVGKYKIYLYEL